MFFFNFWNWSTDEQTDKDLPRHRQCEVGQYPVAQLFWHHVFMFACPAHAPAAKQILEDLRWRESPEHGGPLHSSPSHWDRHHHRIKSELGEICFLQKKTQNLQSSYKSMKPKFRNGEKGLKLLIVIALRFYLSSVSAFLFIFYNLAMWFIVTVWYVSMCSIYIVLFNHVSKKNVLASRKWPKKSIRTKE